MQLSKRAKILIGAGTAWVVLYPFLFIFLSTLSMLLGITLTAVSQVNFFSLFYYASWPLHLFTIVL